MAAAGSASSAKTIIPEVIRRQESELLSDWVREQLAAAGHRSDLIKEADLRRQSGDFLRVLVTTASAAISFDHIAQGVEWKPLRDVVAELSHGRARQGFNPSETATFLFSFKKPLFGALRRELEANPGRLAEELWTATLLIDQLGLYSTEVHQRAREEVIARQQEEMLELSTPVVKMWDGVLALPMIGTLDSSRTQIVMESLLQKIVDTGSEIAIIDITGVPTVDTLVAQHLLKTVTAARLMGAECIISGIRPQIAATIVHLGVDLGHITTKASLADAFAVALSRVGMTVARTASNGKPGLPRAAHPARA